MRTHVEEVVGHWGLVIPFGSLVLTRRYYLRPLIDLHFGKAAILQDEPNHAVKRVQWLVSQYSLMVGWRYEFDVQGSFSAMLEADKPVEASLLICIARALRSRMGCLTREYTSLMLLIISFSRKLLRMVEQAQSLLFKAI